LVLVCIVIYVFVKISLVQGSDFLLRGD